MSEIVVTLPTDASAEEIARVRAAFPDAAFEAAQAASDTPAISFEDQVASAVQAARFLPQKISEAWSAAGGIELLLWLAIALCAAYAIERVLRSLVLDRFAKPSDGQPHALFRQRWPRAFIWTLTRIAGLIVFAVAAMLIGRALPLTGEEARVFGRGLLSAVIFGRVLFLFMEVNAAPRAPERRLINFTDSEAQRVWRAGVIVAVLAAVLGAVRAWLDAAVGLNMEAALARAVLALLLGLITIRFFLAIRQPLRSLMQRREASADNPDGLFTRIANNVALVYVAIVALDMTVKILGALGVLGPAAASGAGASVLLLVTAPLVVAGLGAYTAELNDEERRPLVLGGLALAEGLVVLATAVLLMKAWGVDPFVQPEGGGLMALLPAVIKTAAIVIVGLALWRAVTAVLGEKKADDKDKEAVDDSHSEAGGTGDRIATILPILRGFALALIVLTTAFTALSALGVDVAPLIASAGILGLAIGFGAQTLVTDIISGMFYLYEDAIRIGEYVETESGGGTVEKISLRSATLRHPRGALITVPFSKMGTIRNNSRDWVVMKFSFRVPADTDVEQVRKIIKKVGAQMNDDPELDGKILSPLKSQGAVGITGRSFEIGCKFMCLPGEQFAIRRKAFVLLQRGLKDNGIQLAGQDLDLSAITSPPAAAG
ncbi:MAG: hypothetical protein Kilf2KO_04130 [Rhodospirillales bacterium]